MTSVARFFACQQCGGQAERKRAGQRFCGADCRMAYHLGRDSIREILRRIEARLERIEAGMGGT